MILGTSVTVTPAYGRDYHSAAEAVDAWHGSYDFRIGTDGPYCSRRDFPHDGAVRIVRIRYGKLRNVVEVAV